MTINKVIAFILLSSLPIGFGYSMYQDWKETTPRAKVETVQPIIKEEIVIDECKEKREKLLLPTWWKLNGDCSSQKYIPMQGTTRDERVIELFEGFGYNRTEAIELWDIYRSAGRIGRIRGEFLVCITYADSSLGKALLTSNNPGNVGNTDSGAKKSFKTLEQGIYAIAQTLNNSHLGNKKTLAELTPAQGKPKPYYATSPINWYNNVANCESMILQQEINHDFSFRF